MTSLERFTDPQIRPFGVNITTLPGAKLYFFVANSSTPAVTYSDKQGTIPNSNPVVADSNGIFPPIFIENKLYRVTLTDRKNLVQPGYPLDNIGQDTITVPFGPWKSSYTYSSGEIVTGSDGNWYSSAVNNNLGHDPVTTTGFWDSIPIPTSNSFTSNNENFTWSSGSNQISLDVDIPGLSQQIESDIFTRYPEVKTSFRDISFATNSDVFFDDPMLTISSLPVGHYKVDVYLQFTTGGSTLNGIKVDIVKPSGQVYGFSSCGVWSYTKSTSNQSESTNVFNSLLVQAYPTSGSGRNGLNFSGIIYSDSESPMIVRWAQATLTPGNDTTVVRAFIVATRLKDL